MFNKHLRILTVTAVVGLFLFLLPVATKAAELPRDVLIKGPGKGTAVYYLAYDDRRYVFPNQQTYLTWFQDFSDIYEVSLDELASFPIGGNVTYRPGVRMIKITTDPQVYAVDQNACLRWVTSEDVAIELYGSDWNKKIDDVPDAFFVDYQICDPIYSTFYYQPLAAAQEMTNINSLKSIATSGKVRVADTIPDIGNAIPRSCTPTEDITKSGLRVALSEGDLATENFMLLAGDMDVVLGEFSFEAENESLKISSLRFTVKPASFISGIRLYYGDQQISDSVAMGSDGRAIFSNIDFVVSKSQRKNLIVKGDIRPIGSGGVRSGQKVQVTMDSSYFRAESVLKCSDTHISGGVVLGERLPLSAQDRVIRQSKPVIGLEPLSDNLLSNENKPILKFSIKAGVRGDLAFRRLVVPVSGEFDNPISLRLSQFGNLRRVSDGAILEGDYRISGNCIAVREVGCNLAIILDKWETVLAGESQMYEVLIELEGDLTNGDTLEARLEGDINPIAEDNYPVISTYNFAWTDDSGIANADSIVHGWANGAHIQGLPTETQSLGR